MSIDGFQFEGRDVTAKRLKREITAYDVATLQSALEHGMQTRADVIAFCEQRIAMGKAKARVAGYAAAGGFSFSKKARRA